MVDLLQMLHNTGRVSIAEADNAKAKFTHLCSLPKPQIVAIAFKDQIRDNFYQSLLANDDPPPPRNIIIQIYNF